MNETIDMLMVEDNRRLCQVFQDYFTDRDEFNVVGLAHDGENGLNMIRENSIDVLILDLILPHIDGIGVMERLDETGLKDDLTVIVVSAFMKENVAARLSQLGVDYYVLKPFSFSDLEKRIKEMVQLNNEQVEKKLAVIDLNDSQLDNDDKEINLEKKISEVLHNLGVPAHIKGYHYLKEAIGLVIDDVELLGAVTKKLYPQVAEEFDTTSSRVERAIRHAVDVVWEDGNREELEKYFANKHDASGDCPPNSQFIAEIAERMRFEVNQ